VSGAWAWSKVEEKEEFMEDVRGSRRRICTPHLFGKM